MGFRVCTVPYMLAGDFCTSSLQPTFYWRSDVPALGKQEQDGMRAHLCWSQISVRVRVCVPLCALACMHKLGPGSPSPSPLGALKNEGGNLRAAVIIHPSKQMGRRQRRSWEGGRDVGRKQEKAKWEG